MPSTEYKFVTSQKNISQYAGKWIAVVGRNLSVGDTIEGAITKANHQFPKKEPHIMKVPAKKIFSLT